MLLRPEADGPTLTGMLEDHLPDGIDLPRCFGTMSCGSGSSRPKTILAGDLATLPLAPIARVSVGGIARD